MNFQEHLNNIPTNVKKAIGRQSLVTAYEAFIRPHLDYEVIIYDQTYNESFPQKMKSMQYKSALAIAGAIRGTSREKFYQELSLESLRKKRWYRKIYYFFKIFQGQFPEYFFRILPSVSKACNIRTNGKIPLFGGKHNFFINSFFPSTVIE